MTNTANNSGIYSLTVGGKIYIGASQNLKSRMYHHKRDLHLNRHHVAALQSDFNQLNSGNSAITFSVLEYCNLDQLHDREDFHIEIKKPDYNSKKAGGGVRAITDEARENSSKRMKGKQMRYLGDFVVPHGTFSSSVQAASASDVPFSQFAVWKACKFPDVVITRLAYAKSRYLSAMHDESVIGRTWGEIGFGFVAKAEDDTGIRTIGERPTSVSAMSQTERAALIERLKAGMSEGLAEIKAASADFKASKRHQ